MHHKTWERKRNLLKSWYTFSFPFSITLGNYFWNGITHCRTQFIWAGTMKRRWTAANTTECSGFLLRPIMRAAYFPHSVWAVTHVLAQKQSRDCTSRSGSSMPSLRTGECICEQGFTWMSLLQKTTESRNLSAKDKIFFKKALSSMLNPHSNVLSRIYPGHRINWWSLRCYSQK